VRSVDDVLQPIDAFNAVIGVAVVLLPQREETPLKIVVVLLQILVLFSHVSDGLAKAFVGFVLRVHGLASLALCHAL
jgi:hypothetical protein